METEPESQGMQLNFIETKFDLPISDCECVCFYNSDLVEMKYSIDEKCWYIDDQRIDLMKVIYWRLK